MNIINQFVKNIFGSHNDRELKNYAPIISKINAIEESLIDLSDEDLRSRTKQFKNELSAGKTLEQILPEAFAVVREASKRVLGIRHYDVQLIGGLVLNQAKIAEMATGEGKTLVATLPAYLNSLEGRGVHIVTVNDYLASRDANWMGKIYEFLGLSVGVVVSGMSLEDKINAYACDITYATNNELGFDYLRDNMCLSKEQKTQKHLFYAIIDEVDSILIDEARTPLIISGPTEDHSKVYKQINKIAANFKEQLEELKDNEPVVKSKGDFVLDRKHKQVHLTEDGHAKAEDLLNKMGVLAPGSSLYDSNNIMLMQNLNSSLRAHNLFNINDNYIVRGDEILIVDEFTGRTMHGRRWSEGLHQAIEAKEGVSIKQENQTLASITYQNFFRLYKKISGMTGTAHTEALELLDIYGLEVVMVPPNIPSARTDDSDIIFATLDEKLNAIVGDVKGCQAKQQPVLIGTGSIETSEAVSNILNKNKIKHEVLNAKQHEREAEIIANAGSLGAVTIATNMAGRGTDIVLGGVLKKDADPSVWKSNREKVIKAGGLRVLGTERNESRRVDNQLKGRSARQGDVGSSRFYLSLEDKLVKIFASEKTANMMKKLGLEKGESLQHGLIDKTIQGAQKKVEVMNYEARKHLLEYDDIANEQRKIIYDLRDSLINALDIKQKYIKIREKVLRDLFFDYISNEKMEEEWDIEGLQRSLKTDFACDLNIKEMVDSGEEVDKIFQNIVANISDAYKAKEAMIGEQGIRSFERLVMLRALDHFWKEHLASLDYLRNSISLRGYGNKSPLQEYKRESFDMFKVLLDTINIEMVKALSLIKIDKNDPILQQKQQAIKTNRGPQVQGIINNIKRNKIGRNEACHCGSGKKFKHCHGKSVSSK